MNFSDLVGKTILIHTNISGLEEQAVGGKTVAAEITGVESGGIWVIAQDGFESRLGTLAGGPGKFRSDNRATSHVFLPFSSIVFAVARSPVLDEGSLGLEETHE